MKECALCQEAEATEICNTCENELCWECNEDHQHCVTCGGSGVDTWNVMRNSAGEYDYLHGELTGETENAPCRRCEETGLRL